MKKVFIHIGLHKTATTWLQKYYFCRLRDCSFLSVPFTQQNSDFNRLQYSFDPFFDPESLRKLILEKIDAGPEKLIISDENFSGNPSCHYLNRTFIAERLARVCPDAEIILFIRNQKDLIYSLYNQAVKNNWFSGPLNEKFIWFPNDVVGPNKGDLCVGRSSRYFNRKSKVHADHFAFDELCEFYSSLFPKVHVFLFEEFVKDLHLTLKRLSQIIQSAWDPSPMTRPVNQSLGHLQLLLARFFNSSHLFGDEFYERSALRWHAYRVCEWLLPNMKYRSPFLESPRFLQYFSESNRRLAERCPEIGMLHYGDSYGIGSHLIEAAKE